MYQQFVEIRYWLAQGDFEGIVIDRFYAEVGNRFFAGDDVINIGDVAILQIARVRRGGVWIRQALPAINEILCGNRGTIRPFCVFTQVEGPDFKIFVFPFFGNPGNRVAVYVSNQQTFEQVAVNVRLRYTFNFVRIQRLNLSTVVTHQRLLLRQLNPSRYVSSHCNVARD